MAVERHRARPAAATSDGFPAAMVVVRHPARPAAATADGVPAAMVVERHPARPYCCSHSRGRCSHCTSVLLVVEIHPGCLYCWLWKDTLHVNTVTGEKTHCTSARPNFQLRKDFLHIPTAGGENTLCTSILLLVHVHTYIPYHIE
jgi:hypothetical protein